MSIYVVVLWLILAEIFVSLLIRNRVLTIIMSKKLCWKIEIKKEIKHIFLVMNFIILFVIAVFRDESVGQDYSVYIGIFEGFLNLDYDSMLENEFAKKGEVLFVALGIFLKAVVNDYLVIVCAVYFLMLLFVYRFIKKYANDVLLSGFLFYGFSFYNMSLNILRQYMAAAIVLLAIDYIEEKPVKFFLCVLVAMLFHKTAIVFVILYPVLNYIRNIRISCALLLAICGVAAVFSDNLIYMIGDLANYGDTYTTAGEETEIDLKIFVNIILFITYFYFAKQFQSWDKNANKWIAMSAVTLGLNFTALYFHYVNRMFLYFMLPEIVSLPNFINSFKSNEAKIVMRTIMIVVFSLYYTILVCNTSCYGTVPYTSNVLDIR